MSLIELDDSPFNERKKNILLFIEDNACGFIGKRKINEISKMSETIMFSGIKQKDATHLACSIVSKCDFFITTDKRVLNYTTDAIKICNPIQFVALWRSKYE